MLRSPRTSLSLICAIPFALISSGFARGPVGPIVESDVVTLAGNVHPLVQPEFDRGAVAPETRLERMVLVLQANASQQRELDALTEAQQDPASPQYHQWLTPAEYGARFGASAGNLAQICGWLQGHGFSVEAVSAGRRLIVFSGTAGQVEEAFHTHVSAH